MNILTYIFINATQKKSSNLSSDLCSSHGQLLDIYEFNSNVK